MILSEIQTAIDRRTGLSFDAVSQIDLINEALQAISAERDWPWLDAVDTFNGDGTTTATDLPADWVRTRSVNVNGYLEARPISVKDLDRWPDFEDRPGTYCYAVENGQLIIKDEVPDGVAVTHRYVSTEPALVGPGDTPLLPARFHPYIVAYVGRIEIERMGDAKKSAFFAAEEAAWRKRMVDEQLRTRGPKRIRVRNGYPL